MSAITLRVSGTGTTPRGQVELRLDATDGPTTGLFNLSRFAFVGQGVAAP
jgi:hypothetical protein